MPQIAAKLLNLANNPDCGPEEFAAPIEADPGLSVQVLRFVNSSYFGFAREISNVKLAISMVGVRTIKNFALWSAVFSLNANPRCGPFDLTSLWQDSLRRGLFARRFGALLKLKDAEEAFAAGLLQDMALPVLAQALPAEYEAMLAERPARGLRLSQLEQERFGWSHADAGLHMAKKWNFPAGLAQLIATHTKLELLSAEPAPSGLQKAVTLSALLPAVSEQVWRNQDMFDELFARLSPSDASLTELLDRVDDEYRDFAPLLKLTGPVRPLSVVHQLADRATAAAS
jgi:HD-like signal output (HDOD) protein